MTASPPVAATPVVRLGLTGGIGSGKSTVARRWAQLGAAVMDADAISRSVTAPGGIGIPAITEAFGADFVGADGAMDRDRMRSLVFQDPQAKQRLERIIHPLVGQETQRLAQAALDSGKTCLVFDIPLLVESTHWRSRLDRVLVVDCAEETQVQRVMVRNGLTRAAVQSIMAQQASRQTRLAAADMVIFNDGIGLDALDREVDEIAKCFGL
jgi:dephospho-CoA kinase